MIKKLKATLKTWLGVTAVEEKNKSLSQQLLSQQIQLREAIAELKDYTRVDADISPYRRGECSVIVTGVYRNKGFVSFYDMSSRELSEVVDFIKHKERHALVRNIDAPSGFRQSFDI